MAIRWVSSPESIKQNEPSVLAIVETVAAMAVTIWMAVRWQTYVHIAVTASIAPFLLTRTDDSCLCGATILHACLHPVDWLVNMENRFGRPGKVVTFPVAAVAYVVFVLSFPLARFMGSALLILVRPRSATKAVTHNWQKSTVVVDFRMLPNVLPAPAKYVPPYYPGHHLCKSVGSLVRDLWNEPEMRHLRPLYPVALALLSPILLPLFAYRWSPKSTAIIWFPLLWALRSVREAKKPLGTFFGVFVKDPITHIVQVLSILAIAGFIAKVVLWNTWAGYEDIWTKSDLLRTISLYVVPTEIHWWQCAMFVNSVIAIAMFILAKRWLVRIEHDQLDDETWRRRAFQVGLFIRPILSCYTIACTLYITIRAASDWSLPPLGAKPFPWG